MAIVEVCDHEFQVREVLTDLSIVYDCRDCLEPLVMVNGSWVTVAESAHA